MNKTITRIISTVVCVVLLFCAVAKCADVLERKEARKIYTPFYESETNFDVIFMGTSHVYNHVLPMEMWDEYGIASFNWGYSNCTPAENYYLIQDILRYTSPKVLVMDVYGLVEYNNYNNGKYHTNRIEQQHVQFDSLPIWSLSKMAAAFDVFDDYDNNVDFIWNFIMYHNRWSELEQSDFDYDISTEKGAQYLPGLGTTTFTPISEDEKTEIDSVCYPYYLKIIEYCQERGIQVLCAYIPFAASAYQQRVANSIGEIVEQYPNCSYVNMLTEGLLDFDTDIYSDNSHLNFSGASKVTSWLGQYLRDHYDLDDYRENASWNDDYAEYYAFKLSNFEKMEDLPTYLTQLIDDDFSATLEVYNPKLLESERLMRLCENAGITPEYTQSDTEDCAHLVITSAFTGEVVAEESFSYHFSDDLNITAITKVKK